MKIRWKVVPSGSSAMLGKICIGGTFRMAGNSYKANCHLPFASIPTSMQVQSNEADARKVVELAAETWIKAAGLK